MLVIPRRAAWILYGFAALNALLGAGPAAVLMWVTFGTGCTLYVQWHRHRGDPITQARLWYATPPLWVASVIPLVLAAPLEFADKILTVIGLAAATWWTHSISVAHEHLMNAMHGPVTPRLLAG